MRLQQQHLLFQRILLLPCTLQLVQLQQCRAQFANFEQRNGIFLPGDYNKVVAPGGSSKNFVTIGFEIHDIPQVNDMQYTVTLSMSIYCKWNDSR